MAVPVARVHLKVAHAALPALLPTPPVWKKLPPLLPTAAPPPCLAPILLLPKLPAHAKPKPKPKPKPGRADSAERWDAHKTKPPACPASAAGPRSACSVRCSAAGAGHGSSRRKNSTAPPPPPRPGRADAAERWDTHKKGAIPAAASSSSSSSSMIWSRASSTSERWDAHKNRCCPSEAELLDDGDGESSTTSSSDDIDMEEEEEEEEIVWKPRAMYAGSSFAIAAPQPSMVPVPTAFLLPVA